METRKTGQVGNPLVSVVIAVRNGERFLAAAINSALAQNYHPFEIIVVDGQSTDQTAGIAQSFENVRYIRQVKRGIADAYNVGIDAAAGEFVVFLSHDDLWTVDKLSTQVRYMIEHPEIEYSIARARFFLEPGFAIPPGFRKELLEGEHVAPIMETLAARKSVFDVVGRFNGEFAIANDADWFARANDCGLPMTVIPKVLLHKRIHDTNLAMNFTLNNQNLLKLLKDSIQRKRHSASQSTEEGDDE